MIDFILSLHAEKPIPQVWIDFILEDFPEKEIILINDSYVFEIIENKNNTITLKPMGTNIHSKEICNFEEKSTTYRYIKNGEIIEKKE